MILEDLCQRELEYKASQEQKQKKNKKKRKPKKRWHFKMSPNNKLEIQERRILFNGIEIEDGTFVKFNYGKKSLEYCGYFYISDLPNRLFGCDFMISGIKKEKWKFWSWNNGYIQ